MTIEHHERAGSGQEPVITGCPFCDEKIKKQQSVAVHIERDCPET